MGTLKRLLLFALGLVCLGIALPDFLTSWTMSRWPTTPGKVVYAETRQEQEGERFRYFADIDVEYTVNGARLRTRSVRSDSLLSASDRAWSDRMVGYYQRQRDVVVHYRAENPADARVEIDPHAAAWVLLIWGGCALFASWWSGRSADVAV
jgi:hypothetical protein